MNFVNIKLLDKDSMLRVLREIRGSFSAHFYSTLRLNRKKRRGCNPGGRDYVVYVRELKEQARNTLQRAVDEKLQNYEINEETLMKSYQYLESDPEVKSAVTRLCSVVNHRAPFMLREKVETVLNYYLERAGQFDEEDPNDLNTQMKMLEDEMAATFQCEPEDIEAAVAKYEKDLRDLVSAVKDLNTALLERTNEDLF